MPMKEGYRMKPKGNSLEENPKLLDELRNEAHKGMSKRNK